MSTGTLLDAALLRTLAPPAALNSENFQELAGKAYVEIVPAGSTLFRAGELDRKTIYLIEGEVELSPVQGVKTLVTGGTELARHPLVNQQPRQHTAIARTACRVTRLDSDLLDILLTWDQLAGIEVEEIRAEDAGSREGDWMTRILQSRAFLQVPPANIQAMFMRMQEVPVAAGATVIRQGDEGDYYYIIRSGRAKVTRLARTGAEITLAQLAEGDAFGEEALLSEAQRNATITMVTDGVLMRLSKADFNSLLREPMLSRVSLEEARRRIAAGARWLDVRLDSEHEAGALPDSLNIPLFALRLKAESLDPATEYVCYCDTGRRSSAAAFLLSERGFRTCVLSGGLIGAGLSAESARRG
jgi:CRP-like cAMP-binding protein